MKIKPLRKDIIDYLVIYNLNKKYEKAKRLFENDIKHRSLNTELLEPSWRGIYSFRLEKNTGQFFLFPPVKLKLLQ